MATLKQLEEQRDELEERLEAGDPAAESALARLDAAIRARLLKIQHSQKRLQAVKAAESKGVSVEQAKAAKPKSVARKKAEAKANKPVNRFE
jgi:hypothetical protein